MDTRLTKGLEGLCLLGTLALCAAACLTPRSGVVSTEDTAARSIADAGELDDGSDRDDAAPEVGPPDGGEELTDAPDGAGSDGATPEVGPPDAGEEPVDTPDTEADVATGQPVLEVQPADVVDFGLAGPGVAIERQVVLRNVGSAALHLASVAIEGDEAGAFDFASEPGLEPIPPGAERVVTLVFLPPEAPVATPTERLATLRILSDAPLAQDVSVLLRGLGVADAFCEARLEPAGVVLVPTGATPGYVGQLLLENTGSGPCALHSAFVQDCPGWMASAVEPCPIDSAAAGGSTVFELGPLPPMDGGGLEPGEAVVLTVTAKPPTSAPWGLMADGRAHLAAHLGVRVVDPNAVGSAVDPLSVPGPSLGPTGAPDAYAPNLHLVAPAAGLVGAPTDMQLGTVPIGCPGRTGTWRLLNPGAQDADLVGFEASLALCSPELVLAGLPPLPTPLPSMASVTVAIAYLPQDVGTDGCALAATATGGATAALSVTGNGTLASELTDHFVYGGVPPADLLLVADGTGSMADDLAQLEAALLAQLGATSNDFRLGVTSMDLEAVDGRLLGEPRWLDAGGLGQLGAAMALLSGAAPEEQGLAAARRALGLPHMATLDQACTAESDCPFPYACHAETCGGANHGFLRAEASLHVIFFTDTDDESVGDPAAYAALMLRAKGADQASRVHLHALLDDCGASGSPTRYTEATAAGGGSTATYCSGVVATALEAVLRAAFAPEPTFQLSSWPLPESLQVEVAGAPCPLPDTDLPPSPWSWDTDRNAVTFTSGSPCTPAPGDEVVVTYELGCGG